MALHKTIISRAGFEISYWKITNWNIIMSSSIMGIDLTPYVSSETRHNGLDPVIEETRKIKIIKNNYINYFSPTALELSPDDIYKIMYTYIKEKVPEFKEAIDI